MKQKLKTFSVTLLKNFILFIAILLLTGLWQTRNHLKSTDETQKFLHKITALQTIGERDHHLDPDKKTLVYFFASWCQVCKLNYQTINNVYARNRMNVIGIALESGTQEQVNLYLNENNIQFPVYLGTEETGDYFKVSAFPTFYFISKDDTIITSTSGYTTQLGIFLRSLL